MKVPDGTQTGKQFRLKGKGMPVLRSNRIGDMYIQVVVETPRNLTRRQRELLEEFEQASSAENNPESTGFFARVRDFFDGLGGQPLSTGPAMPSRRPKRISMADHLRFFRTWRRGRASPGRSRPSGPALARPMARQVDPPTATCRCSSSAPAPAS